MAESPMVTEAWDWDSLPPHTVVEQKEEKGLIFPD